MVDLQKYRKDNHLDQKDISKITGLDQSIISKYETGRHVTKHVTDILLQNIPELESYMIEEKTIVSDVDSVYNRSLPINKLIDNIHYLIQNNDKLIDNNSRLVETNSLLAKRILELSV